MRDLFLKVLLPAMNLLSCLDDLVPLVDPATGAALAAAATSARKQLGFARRPAHEARWGEVLETLEAELGRDAFAAAWKNGCDWSLDRATQCVMARARAASDDELNQHAAFEGLRKLPVTNEKSKASCSSDERHVSQDDGPWLLKVTRDGQKLSGILPQLIDPLLTLPGLRCLA